VAVNGAAAKQAAPVTLDGAGFAEFQALRVFFRSDILEAGRRISGDGGAEMDQLSEG
jgi:hypothetical protein